MSHLAVEFNLNVGLIKQIGSYYILMDHLIGEGHYGKVYLSYKHSADQTSGIDTNQPLACKILERSLLDSKVQRQIQNEIQNLELVQSNSVVKLHHYYKTHSRYYIITEYCNGGDLELLKKARGGNFTEQETQLIMSKIACGLKDLYNSKVIHRDLKLPNILLNFPKDISMMPISLLGCQNSDSKLIHLRAEKDAKINLLKSLDLLTTNFEIKIADFGFSKTLSETSRCGTFCGTPLYMAPQIITDDIRYSYKADIWSFGIIFFEILTGKHPFIGRDLDELKEIQETGKYTLDLPYTPSFELLEIIQNTLQYEESSRISIEDLAALPYLKSHEEHKKSWFSAQKKSQNRASVAVASRISGNFLPIKHFRQTLNCRDAKKVIKVNRTQSHISQEAIKKGMKRTNKFRQSKSNEHSFENNKQMFSPEKVLQHNLTCDFVLQNGHLIEESQYIITKDSEFTHVLSVGSLLTDYFNFE